MERHLGEQVERRTQDLQAALEQKTALLHEVEHRVKNSLQMTASIVLLKARRLQNPEARKVLQEIAERVGALSTAHRLLYAAGDVSRFNLRDFTVEWPANWPWPSQKDKSISNSAFSLSGFRHPRRRLLLCS
jgi:two-component sensor histidine kinase